MGCVLANLKLDAFKNKQKGKDFWRCCIFKIWTLLPHLPVIPPLALCCLYVFTLTTLWEGNVSNTICSLPWLGLLESSVVQKITWLALCSPCQIFGEDGSIFPASQTRKWGHREVVVNCAEPCRSCVTKTVTRIWNSPACALKLSMISIQSISQSSSSFS